MIKNKNISENSILYEVIVYHEWHQENEGPFKKPRNDEIDLYTTLSALNPMKYLKKSTASFDIKSVTDLSWKIAVSHDGTLVAVLQENCFEIRSTRDGFTTVIRKQLLTTDQNPQLRLMVWSLDSTVLAIARENMINLYNSLGNILTTVPHDGIENPVIGLMFLNTKFKSAKWLSELLIVSFNGTVRSVQVSADEVAFYENFTFSLASHYPKGVLSIGYHPEHHMLLVSGHHCCGKGRNGITAWRILNDRPFLKLAFGLENDEVIQSRWKNFIPSFREQLPDVIRKMKISPNGQNLVCIHSNGSISFWTLPGIKLIKIWPLYDQPNYSASSLSDKPVKNDLKFWPVDVEWWSDEAVIIVRRNGAVTVCSKTTMENLLGEAPEFLSGPPQIASIRAERVGVILLDYEVVVNYRNQINEMTIEENTENEEDVASNLQESIQSVLYIVTDIETFQPKKRAAKHVQKIYRLVGLNEITSEILFHREIESGAFENALILAQKYGLDSDLVYQRQWQMSLVTSETITDCLSKIQRKDWIANECVRCVPDTYDAALKLLEFGLEVTKDEKMPELRLKISAYLDWLHLYHRILPSDDHYDKNEYEELRQLSTLEAAVKYARVGRRDALSALMELRSHILLPHWLPILSNFPETVNPRHYRELFPKFEKSNCENWKKFWLKLSEMKKFTSIVDEDERIIYESNPMLMKFKTCKLDTDLMYEWVKMRAFDIDEFSGLIQNAFYLVELVIANGVPDKDQFLNSVKSLNRVVAFMDDTVCLQNWNALNHLQQALLVMTGTQPNTFIADLQKKFIPFVECIDCDPVTLLTQMVSDFATESLQLPLVFFRSLKEGIAILKLDTVETLKLALDCLYAYPNDDELEKCYDIIECLPARSEKSDEMEIRLHQQVDELEIRLFACQTLTDMGYPKSLNYLKLIAKDEEKATEMIRMAAYTAQRNTENLSNLLNDLLDIQAALPCIDVGICYELYARNCLLNPDTLKFTKIEKILTLKRDEPKFVPFDRSIELIIEAATAHFDTSCYLDGVETSTAWSILSLVNDEPNDEINQLKGLIRAIGIIRNDVLISPLNVRRMANRWQLFEKCVKSSQRIYKNYVITLAESLGLEEGNRNQMEGKAFTIAANHAYEIENFDYCFELCKKIVSLDYSPAWDISQKICKTWYFRPEMLEILAFAILHCPKDYIEDIIETRIALRTKN